MIDKPEIDETASQLAMLEENQRKGSGRFALFVALLALFFTAAGIASGYKHWQRMNDKAVANQAAIDALQQRFNSAASMDAVEKLRADVETKTAQADQVNEKAVQEMARLQNQTRQFADTVASQVEQVTLLQARTQQNLAPADHAEWQLSEVAFLLQLANRELYLAQNAQTAKAALKEADSILAKVGSVNYLPVRQQITRDLTALEAYAAPDVAGISQRITAMMLALKPLPVAETEVATPTPPATTAAEPESSSLWQDYKRKAVNALSDAVVIRQYDRPIKATLDADARLQLFQLLHLRLENLRLLALQRMDVEYHQQAQLLSETVKAYYPEAQAKPLLEQLAELNKAQLQPPMPDIAASLKQLESARQAEIQAQAAKAAEAAQKAQAAESVPTAEETDSKTDSVDPAKESAEKADKADAAPTDKAPQDAATDEPTKDKKTKETEKATEKTKGGKSE